MSLQVWLPLLGNTKNQGLSGISVTNNGATVNDNGKLGKCYYFNGDAQYLQLSATLGDLYSHDFSYSVWLKPTDSTRSIIMSDYASSGASGVAYELTTSRSIRLYWNGSPDIYPSNCVLPLDTWTHTAIVKTTNRVDFYVNGELRHTYTGTLVDRVSSSCLRIGDDYRGGSSVSYMGYMNDVRIYNHALSAKEVKELSKGLVTHYTLGDRYVAENLIINGFGELGSENWESSSNISTTEIPSGDSRIKASFYNGNRTKEYISINPTHTYTISGYIKSSGATSGNTYPSIFPYDIDKKFINNYNSTDGFSTTWATTLAQPLKKGDTVVYATDLSSWSTANNNYYYHVAIFGYKDSFGTVYRDFVYTADSPSFGSYSDKSNINKTNNTITLNSPFTGEDRPAGTKICQATEGSTYYYPWGGIALSSIPDWTFKTGTFTPYSTGRLKACRYVTWSTYQNCYIAGNLLVDNTNTDRTVYDSSGYNYHGATVGTLSVSSNTPRYSVSTKFANPNYIQYKAPANMYYATYSFWVNFDSFVAYGAIHIPKGNPTGGDTIWFSANTESTSLWAYFGGNSPHYNKVGTGNLVTNTWYHFAFTWNNGVSQWYLNGEPLGASVTYTGKTYIPNTNYATIGNSYTGTSWSGTPFNGRISDFRLYATALSADDIKELYQTSASIDKSGNMYAYEFNEV